MVLKFPDASNIVAGACGGPLCYFTVTPFRNACTLGATNATAGALELYGSVFSGGFLRGWTGGIYPSMYAGPTFIVLGPLYHALKDAFGLPLGVVLASATESGIMYGAETKNAQMAKKRCSAWLYQERATRMEAPWPRPEPSHWAQHLVNFWLAIVLPALHLGH